MTAWTVLPARRIGVFRQFGSMGVARRLAGHGPQPKPLGGIEGGSLQPAIVERETFALAIFQKQLPIIGIIAEFVDQGLDFGALHTVVLEEKVAGYFPSLCLPIPGSLDNGCRENFDPLGNGRDDARAIRSQ